MADDESTSAGELLNPFTGQTIRFVEESAGVLVMESSYRAGGPAAPAHLHPSQEERFTVLSGSVLAGIEGKEWSLREGEELLIPAGAAHTFGGHATEDGTVRWEVRPPLRTWEFFERLFVALRATADSQAEGTGAPPSFDFGEYDDVFLPA